MVLYQLERMRDEMNNEKSKFDIRFNTENGGVDSMIFRDDPQQMNWMGIRNTWGTVKDATVVSVECEENSVCAVYETPHLRITVNRRCDEEKYRESYTIQNRIAGDVFCNRGMFGIYTPFRDGYANASISMTQRCHTHIWCGRNTSYVRAAKMGPARFGLGLVLTEGSLDTYSVDRELTLNEFGHYMSEDRGDFILHPSPFHLKPNECMRISWEMFWYEDGRFDEKLKKYDDIIRIRAERFTVFTNENITFSVCAREAEVFLDGNTIPTKCEGDETTVYFAPKRTGDHLFVVRVGKKETIARFFVQIPIRELIEKRVRFIMEKQQYLAPNDMLNGAFLIYDTKEKEQVFNYLFTDHNASRERLVMGLLVAKYLQHVRDEKMYARFMKYYRFVTREFYDEKTGEVYNNVGKHSEFKRLYNAPWMSVLVLEMYNLTGDKGYLEKMFRLLTVYYSIGGERFYPNGLSVYESVTALKKAGMEREASELLEMYRKHADNILKNGIAYPEHEIKYEQTIVAPAVNILAQFYMLTEEKKYLEGAHEHLKVLERFNGSQPSHFLNDQPIRHWDGYWFGKRRMYADTFPHSAAVHTSNAFLHYAAVTGNEEYKKRAENSAGNILSLFSADGSASCAYLYPFSVNGIGCEAYDEYANEQDGYLYYLIKFFGCMDDDKSKNESIRFFSKDSTELK